jgi:hypothetical protein
MSANVLQALATAISGLLYMSETDTPFEIVHWKKQDSICSTADLLSLIGKSSGLPVENVGLGEFFHDLIQDHDCHDAEAKKTVDKYRHLLTVLEEHLTDLKVFKVGEVEIDIYIVGRTAEGDWAGVMTTAVET